MKECNYCGKRIQEYDEICPYCENSEEYLAEESRQRKKLLLIFLALILIIGLPYLTMTLLFL